MVSKVRTFTQLVELISSRVESDDDMDRIAWAGRSIGQGTIQRLRSSPSTRRDAPGEAGEG